MVYNWRVSSCEQNVDRDIRIAVLVSLRDVSLND